MWFLSRGMWGWSLLFVTDLTMRPQLAGTTDKAGLHHRHLPAPASRVLALKTCATTSNYLGWIFEDGRIYRIKRGESKSGLIRGSGAREQTGAGNRRSGYLHHGSHELIVGSRFLSPSLLFVCLLCF